MRKPAAIIRKLVAKNFPVRSQQVFCLTESQFEARWSNLVSDIRACYGKDGGLPSQLLEPSRARLEAMWVRITDDAEDCKTDRIRQWPAEPASNPAIKPEVPERKATFEEVAQALIEYHKLDGYQMFRVPKPALSQSIGMIMYGMKPKQPEGVLG